MFRAIILFLFRLVHEFQYLPNFLNAIWFIIRNLGIFCWVDKEIAQDRLKTCKNCKFCIKKSSNYFSRCIICACFLTLKTKISCADCSQNKWEK